MAGGRPQHEYSEKIAIEIKALLTFGIAKARISSYVGLSEKTLIKHYSEIIENTLPNRDEAVEASLFHNATVRHNVAAQIFYLSTQCYRKYGKAAQEQQIEDPKPMTVNFHVNPAVKDIKITEGE